MNKENIHFKRNILNNIKLKSKLKFSLNKEIKTQPEIKEESKESIYIPSAPKIKKQILRNNQKLRKIPSTNNIYISSLSKNKLINTINYSSKEENSKKEVKSNINIFQKNKVPKLGLIKHVKNEFYSTHLILQKPSMLCSGTRVFSQSKNKNKNNLKCHKNTISEAPSVNSILSGHNKGNNSNNNTTANTHKDSNKKNISNSFKKSKINLKTLSRKNSFQNNNYIKIKKSSICPIKHIINRNSSNNNISKEESKNNNDSYSFMNKTQSYYNINNTLKEINNISNIIIRNPEEEYIEDILYNLLKEEKEIKIKIDSSYFKNQPEINEKMRAILIDWLIDVNNKFCFKEETLYIAINIIDTYLSIKKIRRCNLQLLGVTALFIACKQNEIIFRRLKEYAYITDNAYDENDILYMEKDILKTIDFNILFPSALSFYDILCHKFGIIQNRDRLNYNLGLFLIQSFYMSANSLKYYASTIASSATYIVMKFFKMKNYKVCYDKKLYNIKEKNVENNLDMNIIKECAKDICIFIGELAKNNLNASIRNFSSEKYGNISKLVFGNLSFN